MWESEGECDNNPDFMRANCELACGICQEDGELLVISDIVVHHKDPYDVSFENLLKSLFVFSMLKFLASWYELQDSKSFLTKKKKNIMKALRTYLSMMQ